MPDLQESRGRKARNSRKERRANDPAAQERRSWWEDGWIPHEVYERSSWRRDDSGEWRWGDWNPPPAPAVQEGSNRWRKMKELEKKLDKNMQELHDMSESLRSQAQRAVQEQAQVAQQRQQYQDHQPMASPWAASPWGGSTWVASPWVAVQMVPVWSQAASSSTSSWQPAPQQQQGYMKEAMQQQVQQHQVKQEPQEDLAATPACDQRERDRHQRKQRRRSRSPAPANDALRILHAHQEHVKELRLKLAWRQWQLRCMDHGEQIEEVFVEFLREKGLDDEGVAKALELRREARLRATSAPPCVGRRRHKHSSDRKAKTSKKDVKDESTSPRPTRRTATKSRAK